MSLEMMGRGREKKQQEHVSSSLVTLWGTVLDWGPENTLCYCLCPEEEFHAPIALPFHRTSQEEASEAGNTQTICVPGNLNFRGKWRSPLHPVESCTLLPW